MVWIATNACNARCLHCSSASATADPSELSTGEVLDLIEAFEQAGVVDLAISGGEPLLRKDLLEIIRHAVRHGLSVGVGSNGSFLDRVRGEALRDAGLHRIQISLDGFAGEHDRLRCWNGLFDRAVVAIRTSIACGLRTHVCCTIHSSNAARIDELADFVWKLGVSRLNFSRFVPTGRGCDALDVPDEQWRAIISKVSTLRRNFAGRLEVTTHWAQQILVEPELDEMSCFTGCQAGRGQGCVSATGTVYPCVLLPIALGNIRDRSFREIWETSPENQMLQNRSLLEGRCGVCPVREKCGGCRAVAYAKTGSLLGEDPRCWMFDHRKEERHGQRRISGC